LGEVESLAAAHARTIMLLVSDFNRDAQRFYERHGYERVGTHPYYAQVGGKTLKGFYFTKRLR
jgi:phosphoribosylformimino-5-aminoimidazole carboxamide ribotide isomerase